ncbi:succinyl-diaminopimelate desuccinylase [Corynebacterium lubricantis]|uniref:succinyl-diaminopimelate desuccinylase n=1 Tax=Corynebacterium lubricantis TaxID=541095 RepID=UPI000476E9C8|nr:succinyl-diaminopimelate desuccinylase [Corynebacterium lubricantis]
MLDLTADPVELTAALIDVASPSHQERELADLIERSLEPLEGVEKYRFGNTLVARTNRGLNQRVVLAGHIDTVPIADNVPHTLSDGVLYGCGSVDMKSGLACYLKCFAELANDPDLSFDLTLIAYEGEEVESEYNGLAHLQRDHPELLEADIALLGEPSGAVVEAGCQGSIRASIIARGTRAHSARAWLGHNAAHDLAGVLSRIASYAPRRVTIAGCEYREGLNVVGLSGGVATNTIPDEATLAVNFRFAPDRSLEEAKAHFEEALGLEKGLELRYDDAVPGALPGLDDPVAQGLITAVGGQVRAKFGWTDVARFSSLGVPAVNYGPGDPGFAHKIDEQCPVDQIHQVAASLRAYLTS